MKHRDVVGAVTHSNRLLDLAALHIGDGRQQLAFALRRHHRPRGLPRQQARGLINL